MVSTVGRWYSQSRDGIHSPEMVFTVPRRYSQSRDDVDSPEMVFTVTKKATTNIALKSVQNLILTNDVYFVTVTTASGMFCYMVYTVHSIRPCTNRQQHHVVSPVLSSQQPATANAVGEGGGVGVPHPVMFCDEKEIYCITVLMMT